MSASASSAGRRVARRRTTTWSDYRQAGLTVLAGALLTLLTVAVFNYLPRYALSGRSILTNTDFAKGFEGWEVAGLVTLDETELGHAILQNRNPEQSVYLRRRINLPPGRTSLRLSAEISTSRVQRGELPWQTARVYLVQVAPNGRRLWNQPNLLASLVGTVSRQRFEEIFETSGSVSQAILGIELAMATGRMEIADLQLAVLDELPTFRLAASLLIAGWSLLAVWVGIKLFRGIRSTSVRGWLIVTGGVLGLGLFIPSFMRQELLDAITRGLGFELSDPAALGHAVVFGVLAFLVRYGRPRDPLLLHVSAWMLAGAATEVMQLFTADRRADAGDWIADAAGAMAGLILAEVALMLDRRLRRSRRAGDEARSGLRSARGLPGSRTRSPG